MSQPPLRLYSYPKCGTCRKALQWLAQRGFSVSAGSLDLVDITRTPPGPAELRQAMAAVGRKRLFNTSGQSYRALGSAAVAALNDDQAIAALAADGKLIKRPFAITAGGAALVGFKPEEWQAALG
ncbi:MAG: Spx/MgsR family RNA polymerase-binding regulatory protein [Cyanobacteria bacterium REEB498]|nr:Spx/MgsR family RNA polymerase-binding regulatory protein [Cyanobacteria bacterium REEB498]